MEEQRSAAQGTLRVIRSPRGPLGLVPTHMASPWYTQRPFPTPQGPPLRDSPRPWDTPGAPEQSASQGPLAAPSAPEQSRSLPPPSNVHGAPPGAPEQSESQAVCAEGLPGAAVNEDPTNSSGDRTLRGSVGGGLKGAEWQRSGEEMAEEGEAEDTGIQIAEGEGRGEAEGAGIELAERAGKGRAERVWEETAEGAGGGKAEGPPEGEAEEHLQQQWPRLQRHVRSGPLRQLDALDSHTGSDLTPSPKPHVEHSPRKHLSATSASAAKRCTDDSSKQRTNQTPKSISKYSIKYSVKYSPRSASLPSHREPDSCPQPGARLKSASLDDKEEQAAAPEMNSTVSDLGLRLGSSMGLGPTSKMEFGRGTRLTPWDPPELYTGESLCHMSGQGMDTLLKIEEVESPQGKRSSHRREHQPPSLTGKVLVTYRKPLPALQDGGAASLKVAERMSSSRGAPMVSRISRKDFGQIPRPISNSHSAPRAEPQVTFLSGVQQLTFRHLEYEEADDDCTFTVL